MFKLKNSLLIILIISFSFFIEGIAYSADTSWQYYNNLANQQHDTENYAEAIKNYSTAIRLNPNEYFLYTNRGTSEYVAGDYNSAITDFKYALYLNPNDNTAKKYLQIIDEILSDNQNGTTEQTKFLRNTYNGYPQQNSSTNINKAQLYFNIGLNYLKTGYYQKALDNFNAAITLGLNNETTHFHIALAKVGLKDYSGAIKDSIEITKKKPNSQALIQISNLIKNIHVYDAKNKFDNKDYEGAIEDYTLAIDLDPKDSDLFYARGNVRFELKDYKGAIEDYNYSSNLKLPEEKLFVSRGHAFYNLRAYNSAIKNYSEAIKLNPKNEQLYIFRGNAYKASGKTHFAIEDYNTSLRIKPNEILANQINALKSYTTKNDTNDSSLPPSIITIIILGAIAFLVEQFKKADDERKEKEIQERRITRIKEKQQRILEEEESLRRQKEEEERIRREEETRKKLAIERQKRSYWQTYWREKQKNGFEFERAVGELYGKMGYKYTITPKTGDNGVDLILYKDEVKTIVQCKAHKHAVGPNDVRALWGVREDFKAQKAIFVAYKGVTTGAKNFTKGKDYKILDVNDLINMSLKVYTEKVY